MMSWLSFLVLSGLRLGSAAPAAIPSIEQPSDAGIASRDADLKVADHILSLKRVGVKSPSSRALLSELASGTATLNPVDGGAGYALDVGLGGNDFTLLFDTGSSDTWAFETGAKCLGPKGAPKPASVCMFGPEFSGTFQDGAIANENFYTTYASGEFLAGKLGYEDVTVAGITVTKQEIAAVEEGYFVGDGVVSGIIGFARSAITNAYPGTNPAKDTAAKDMPYPSFIDHAISEKAISPLFSVVLERGATGGTGQLALGGLPSIPFTHSFVTTPIEKVEIGPNPIEATQYSYYTIIPDGLVLDGVSKATSFPAIVDTGTTLLYLPNELAVAINDAYSPPSVFVQASGVFENKCDAKPPTFAITIGGKSFQISSSELLLQGTLGKDPATGGCVTGIQSSGTNSAVLGDVFLKNVVAVFDLGNEEMRFAAHENY